MTQLPPGVDPAVLGDYTRAMNEHGGKRITLDVSVFDLTCLIALLQIAVQHPKVERRQSPTADAGRQFVSQVTSALAKMHPVFGEVIQRGWHR